MVLHKFDADAALEKSGLDYLIVTSQPPREAKAGATFTYPIKVKVEEREGDVPARQRAEGDDVDAAGVVTWAVPADAPAGDQDIILTVRAARGRRCSTRSRSRSCGRNR